MIRYLPVPLGLGLIFAGFSVLTSTRAAVLILVGLGVLLAVVVSVAARRRRRTRQMTARTPTEELNEWRRFVARRRRSAPWESAIYALIVGAFIWLEGVDLGTILIAAGFGLLLVARWVVEPRTWSEVTRRLADPGP
jgi:hypothetical protein